MPSDVQSYERFVNEVQPVMQAISRMQQNVGGAIPDFLIVEGDLADPRSIVAMEALKRRIDASPVLADNVERFRRYGL